MHFPDYLTFIGAAVLVMQWKESKAFNLGRNVSFIANLDDRNSHDGLIDKEERAQEPATQDSHNTHDGADLFSEVSDRLTEQDHAKKIIDGPFFRQTVEQKGFSNVILSSQIDSFLATTQKPAVVQSSAADSRKSIGRPFGAVLDDISFELGDRVPAFPVNQVADGRASNKDTQQLNVVRLRHSNERDDEDISFEVRSRPVKDGNQLSLERERSPVSLDATDFHNRRDHGFLIQPESEDWFLVKQYMDDDDFRNAAEELAGEYFWQPVKNSKRFDSESAEESNESN